jgi:hypothetical protein
MNNLNKIFLKQWLLRRKRKRKDGQEYATENNFLFTKRTSASSYFLV